MQDEMVHEGGTGFEEFIEEELKGLSERAEEEGICLQCLSDRLIVELVAGITRSGASPADILSIVAEGLEGAEEDAEAERRGGPRRVH